MTKALFPIFSKWTLILTLVVTFAGGFVRMTGSGMGCPDWPKCFGHYIPPTSASELEFQPNNNYDRKQMIIVNDVLLMAKEAFISSSHFTASDWEEYTKHSYSKFNVSHTWTEYINRLSGALLGIFSLLMLLGALLENEKSKLKISLSILVVFLIAFEAWLGMKVVESVLKPVIISMHMIGALIILAVMIVLRTKYEGLSLPKLSLSNKTMRLLYAVMLLSVFQILLGTQVREGLSIVAKEFTERSEWFNLLQGKSWLKSDISMLVLFYVHRSFSIVVLALNFWMYRRFQQHFNYSLIRKVNNYIVAILIIEVLTGAIMYYIEVPGLMQLIHLMFSAFLFGIQFYLIAILKFSKKN